jgi:hypothetical protein
VRPHGLETGDILVLDLEQTDGRPRTSPRGRERGVRASRRRSAVTPSCTRSCPSPRGELRRAWRSCGHGWHGLWINQPPLGPARTDSSRPARPLVHTPCG